ncbi:MAG: cytochrome d ubiquinol oxidase subunit II [Methylococcales bacterium]|nr:cytochrome d ubiquinol oxidase subunit II [Methylococcales bacterium]
MIFDYEMMRVIWWWLLGIPLVGFAIMGGADLGVGLLLYLGKDNHEKEMIINTTKTTWQSSQLWLILTIITLFSAWPIAYSVAFSSLSFVLIIALCTLFLRPLGFLFQHKLSCEKWQNHWNRAIFLSALLPSFLFGLIIGNLLTGLPFQLDVDMRLVYHGDFFTIFSLFSVVSGLLSTFLFAMQGAAYLQLKTEGDIQRKAQKALFSSALLTLLVFAAAGYWAIFLEGYHILSLLDTNAPSTPLENLVKKGNGLWLDNYGHYAHLWMLPASTLVTAVLSFCYALLHRPKHAFFYSSLTTAAIILTIGCSMFPFLVPSNLFLKSSLTIWDASASLNSLTLMFWAAVFLLPLSLLYIRWIFNLLCRKKEDTIVHSNISPSAEALLTNSPQKPENDQKNHDYRQ